jgi:hypothetical protein
VSGDFNGCGWMRDADVVSSSSQTHTGCAPGSIDRQPCDYIACDASQNPQVYGSVDDGQYEPLLHPGCALYPNIRPWSPSQPSSLGNSYFGPFAADANPSAPRFKVRYLAKYAFAGNMYYMVHDTQASQAASGSGWGFMYVGCFS